MANRHFSLRDYFINKDNSIFPTLSYNGHSYEEWTKWKAQFHSKVLELLGPFPEEVPFEKESIWKIEEDGIIKEKVLLNSEEFATIPVIIMKPADLDVNKDHKALLCIHGHGPYGKDSVAGFRFTEDRIKKIEEANYDFALQFCRQGYITFSPDLRGFGERQDPRDIYPGRDHCNVHFIRGLLMGIPLITLHLWDLKVVLFMMESEPYVDANRIGCIGLSLGGTLTMHLTAIDERIKAADMICSTSTYKEYAIKMGNFCGAQFIPNVYKFGDLKDIAGLIAPRPILVESGIHDDGFPIESVQKAIEGLKQIYSSANSLCKFQTDIFNGGHQFSGRKAFEFFDRYL